MKQLSLPFQEPGRDALYRVEDDMSNRSSDLAQISVLSANQRFVNRSKVYQEILAERSEILKHKWMESKRLGCDIGYDRAVMDWSLKHRNAWRDNRRTNGENGS